MRLDACDASQCSSYSIALSAGVPSSDHTSVEAGCGVSCEPSVNKTTVSGKLKYALMKSVCGFNSVMKYIIMYSLPTSSRMLIV